MGSSIERIHCKHLIGIEAFEVTSESESRQAFASTLGSHLSQWADKQTHLSS